MTKEPVGDKVNPEKPIADELPGSGLRSVRTTSLFRAVNFELYARPNKGVMGFGLVALTFCVGYIAYLHAQKENQELYEAYKEDGSKQMQIKSSKWD